MYAVVDVFVAYVFRLTPESNRDSRLSGLNKTFECRRDDHTPKPSRDLRLVPRSSGSNKRKTPPSSSQSGSDSGDMSPSPCRDRGVVVPKKQKSTTLLKESVTSPFATVVPLSFGQTAAAAKKNVKAAAKPSNRVKAATGLGERKQPLILSSGDWEIRDELDVDNVAYVI